MMDSEGTEPMDISPVEGPELSTGFIQPHQHPLYIPIDLNFPGLRMMCANPPVYLIENFLGPEKCSRLIEEASPSLIRAPVVGVGNGEISSARTSTTCFVRREDVPTIVTSASRLLCDKPIEHIELPQVGRYLPSEEYRAHFDAFDLSTADGRRFAENGGQRVCTVLVYLNDVENGGCTSFPILNLDVRPKAGSALVFFPSNAAGELDPLALHAGSPAIDTKWVCQVWVRQATYSGMANVQLSEQI